MNTKTRVELQTKVYAIKDRKLQKVCEDVMNDDKFFLWPASLSYHHNYAGGLADHTLEVWNIAENMADSGLISDADKDVIGVGCLFHDSKKVDEYLLVDEPIPNQRFLQYFGQYFVKAEGKDAGHSHIIEGAEAFRLSAEKHKVDPDLINQIEHVILSHHGFVPAWGSPVAPNTLEALIVHQADMLSAKHGKTK
jgi:3'-5' exoribonuclease